MSDTPPELWLVGTPDGGTLDERAVRVDIRTMGDLARFTVLVALLGILADAAIGHGMLWENDPYWTYWVTKTFLIATVFAIGIALVGAGVARGALITVVHTIILTVYYWSLSPIGLPSHPTWLDLGHTWVTGIPIHFGVIYLGYLTALWLWRRRRVRPVRTGVLRAEVLRAVLASLLIVVVAGALESLALQRFPGLTWFVVRLLVTFPFTLLWWTVAGRDRASAVGGAICLAIVLVTYGHYLSPVGLPNSSVRLIGTDPPPANVEWLTYRQEFLVALPIMVAVAAVVYLASVPVVERPSALSTSSIVQAVAIVAVVVVTGIVVAAKTSADADRATITARGSVRVERGQYFSGDFTPTTGDLVLLAENRNPRVTPLPPHDVINLSAMVVGSDGVQYEIESTTPIIDDPLGRFSTWWGVGFDEWHHGRSGIGSDQVPATRSEVAVFALADVSANGELVARGVPVHVMTTDRDGARLELDVGDPAASLVGLLPDGHLRAVWSEYDGGRSHDGEYARFAMGAVVLVMLLGLALGALRATDRRRLVTAV